MKGFMVKLNIQKLLSKHGITAYRFAKAVRAKGIRSESWAYKTARGEIKLTADGLALVVEVLRDLTGEKIAIGDVLEVIDGDADFSPQVDKHQELEALIILYEKPGSRTGETLATYSPQTEKNGVPWTKQNQTRSPFTFVGGLMIVVVVSFLAGLFGRTSLDAPRVAQDSINVPIPTPIAIGPEGEIQGMEPKLRVEPVPDVTHYLYSVFNLLSRQNVIYENTSEPFLIIPKHALCPNAKYGWKAKAFRGAEESSFSSNMEFSVFSEDPETQTYATQDTQPGIPVAVGPEGTVTTLASTLEVRPVKDAVGYGFYLRNLKTDQVYDFEYQATAHVFDIPEGILQNGGRYRWNARAFNCAGFSLGYSDTLSFEVMLEQ